MAAKKPTPEGTDVIHASTMSTPQQVRLECVKLVYRHDRTSEDAIAKAEKLERFVLLGQPAPAQAGNDGQVEQGSDPI